MGVSSIEFQALPGPEARALRAKTMRRTSFLELGGHPFFPQDLADSEVGAPGRAPDGPAPLCGSIAGSPGGILIPPIFFARNALASGPQA